MLALCHASLSQKHQLIGANHCLYAHCSYSLLGAWCRSHACPRGPFKASPPQSKPYAISDPCPCSKNSLPVHCLHCPGAALALPVSRPHDACALHTRCLCAAMCASIRCHSRLYALPLYLTACVCLDAPRRGAPMAWPWPPIFPQDMLPYLKSILSRFQIFLRRHQNG